MRNKAAYLGVCLLALALPASAVTISAGDEVVFPRDAPVKGDIMAAGREVRVATEVNDVTVAAAFVSLTGPVEGTAMLAGHDVLISGPIGNDLYSAGQRVRLTSAVGDNAYLVGSDVDISEGSKIGTDLLVAGNTLNLRGDVGRVVRAAGNDVTLGGHVGGDVYAKSSGRVHLLKGALIRGSLCYESPERVVMDEGAKVLGQIKQTIPPQEKMRPLFWPRVALSVGSVLGAILFGVLLIGVFPTGTQLAANTLRYSFWQSAGVGLVVLVGVPIACLIASATLIGLPIAACVFLAYLIMLYVAPLMAGLALGQTILGWRRADYARPVLSLALGVVILSILKLIPFLGFVVRFVALVIGLGAIFITWWKDRGFLIVRRRS